MNRLEDLVEIIESDRSTSEDFQNFKLPESMKAVTIHRDEEEMFSGTAYADKDPRQSLHYDEIPMPELGSNEVLVAVMASAVNFNNVWTSIFEPSSAFKYVGEYAKMKAENRKHHQDYHIPGGDGCGVVMRVGDGVSRWKPGDRVTLFGCVCDYADSSIYDDAVRGENSRAWGFETNFGSFAQFCIVQQNQLLPKAEHLSWEEAASITLVATTAYRMLVSRNGARMAQGDNVLIWGASGGLGCYAIQLVKNGGGIPVAVVSNEQKAGLVRKLGCERVIVMPRESGKERFLDDAGRTVTRQILRLKVQIRKLTGGEDPDIVFEHTGRSTFAASVAVAKPGGKIVTCGSTSGYDHVFDNRYLWQTVKQIIGSHGCNYHEAIQSNRLVIKGMLFPVLSRITPLENVAEAICRVHDGVSIGKEGVLNLAPKMGLGIRNREFRERLGEERISGFLC